MMHQFLLFLALAMASLVGAVAVADDFRPPVATTEAAPVDLPVLVSAKAANETITQNDLVMQSFPAKRIRSDIIRDIVQIVGMAAKHPMQPGNPISTLDLMKEQLVKRGDGVSLLYKTGELEINASGKALENGALGDSIKITNTGSNRTVDAKVTGPRQVEVQE